MDRELFEKLADAANNADAETLDALFEAMPVGVGEWFRNHPPFFYGILGLLGALFASLGMDRVGFDAIVFEDLIKYAPIAAGIVQGSRKTWGPHTVGRRDLVQRALAEKKRRHDVEWATETVKYATKVEIHDELEGMNEIAEIQRSSRMPAPAPIAPIASPSPVPSVWDDDDTPFSAPYDGDGDDDDDGDVVIPGDVKFTGSDFPFGDKSNDETDRWQ